MEASLPWPSHLPWRILLPLPLLGLSSSSSSEDSSSFLVLELLQLGLCFVTDGLDPLLDRLIRVGSPVGFNYTKAIESSHLYFLDSFNDPA